MIKARPILLLLLLAGFVLVFVTACGGGGGINRTRDIDGDGMPDWWELTYGLDPSNPNDASLDPDQDGWTNLEEYQNGTDPRAEDPPKELCNGLDDDGNGLIDEIWLDQGKPCGMCGTYQCSADGLSLECPGQGVCLPGDNQNCGSTGMKTCLDTCVWGDCYELLQCTVGEQQTSPCGYCEEGLQTRTCGFDGKWGIWSDCLGRGCRPAATEACQIEDKTGTHECSSECKWSDCVAECNPQDIFTTTCGDCGGTHDRTCRTDGTWSAWTVCQCADLTEARDFPGYEGQTRTCGQATLCKWAPWANCTLEGAECQSGDFETQSCSCGGSGTKIRTCSEICVWGEWSKCDDSFDILPPSTPEPSAPADGAAFYALPITFSWTASADDCGLSKSGAYQITLINMSNIYPIPMTVETYSPLYELNSLPGGNWRWWVRARDAAGNYSEPSQYWSFAFYPDGISSETFDSATKIWNWITVDENSSGGDDHWDKAGSQSYSGMSSAWCAAVGTQSDDKCGTAGATNLSARKYDNGMDDYFEYLVKINKSSYSRLALSFWYWLEVADANDCLKFRIGDQAGTWTDQWQQCVTTNGWKLTYLDLSAFAGQSNITLQFRFVSDGSGHCAEGAYLDDIVVEGW